MLALILLPSFASPSLALPTHFPRVACIPLGLFLLLCLQSACLTIVNPMAMHVAMIYSAAATCLTYAGFRLRNLAGLTAAAAVAVTAGALVSVAIQVVQAYLPPNAFMFDGWIDLRASSRLFANLAQPNHLATYLVWGLAGVLYLLDRRVLGRRSGWLLIILMTAGMVVTASRIAPVQVVLIGAVFGMLRWQRPAVLAGFSSRARKLRACALPLALGLIYLATYWSLGWLDRTILHLNLGGSGFERLATGDVSARQHLWRYGWRMFLSSPYLGGGWGSFPYWQYQHIDRLGPVVAATSAHNVLLDLLAQTGLLGFGVFVVGMARWTVRAKLHALTGKRAFWLCMLGTTFAHALLEYPLHYAYFLLPCAFVLGALDTRPLRWPSVRSAHALCALLLPPMLAGLLVSTSDMRKLEHLFGAPDLPVAFAHYREAPAILLNPYGTFAAAAGISVNSDHPEARLQLQRDALAVLPTSQVMTNYAVALALLGRDDEAMQNVHRLRLFEPENFRANFSLLLWRSYEAGGKLTQFIGKLLALQPEMESSASNRGASGEKKGE
ncbi:PglL family O-oligosaccharyltransferase [Trinickia fusca]|nr:O-antigen ligase family protein [Trinickia fusca]